jgi:hypothetical protein
VLWIRCLPIKIASSQRRDQGCLPRNAVPRSGRLLVFFVDGKVYRMMTAPRHPRRAGDMCIAVDSLAASSCRAFAAALQQMSKGFKSIRPVPMVDYRSDLYHSYHINFFFFFSDHNAIKVAYTILPIATSIFFFFLYYFKLNHFK